MAHDKALALVQIPFHGDAIDAGRDEEGTVWVSVRRVSEAMGLAPNMQIEKLKGKRWARGMLIISHDATGRKQEVFCIPLRALPMWLAGIEPARVKPDLHEKLERYQTEAADVLAQHFLGAEPKAAGADNAVAARLSKLEGLVLELHRGLTKVRHRSPSVKSGDLFPTELEHAPLVAALWEVVEELGGTATAQQIEKAAADKLTPAAVALDQHLRQWVPSKGRESWTMRLGRLFRRMATWEATKHGRVFKSHGSSESVRWGVGFVDNGRKAG